MTQTVWKLRKLWECFFLRWVDCIGYWLRQGIENLFLFRIDSIFKKVIIIIIIKINTSELNSSLRIPTATQYHNCYKSITHNSITIEVWLPNKWLFWMGSFLVNSKHTMQLVRFPNEWLLWIVFLIESNPLHNSEVWFTKKITYESGLLLNQTYTIVWFLKGSYMLAIFLWIQNIQRN